MKRTVLLAFLAMAIGTSSQAGSLADPVIAPAVIVEDAAGSSSGTALVAMLAVLLMIPALD